jgi:hypothetical protein
MRGKEAAVSNTDSPRVSRDKQNDLYILSKFLCAVENSREFFRFLKAEEISEEDYRQAVRTLNDLAGLEN